VLLVRHILQAMVKFPIAKRPNAANGTEKLTHRAFTRCPATTFSICQWDDHCLRAVPCVEISCERCIRKYQVEGVLGTDGFPTDFYQY
jgi:hypothetical protein